MSLKLKLSKFIIKLFGDVQFFSGPFFCLLWGNTHYKVRGDESRVILNTLKKGDILTYRFDRYVSTRFIPGFWTHVALYIGDDKIIHAVTRGVVEDDILTFLRTDYVGVLRPKVSSEDIDKAVSLARGMVGKKYDFLFDSHNDERMYCSEVVRNAYPVLFADMKEDGIPPGKFFESGVDVIHDSTVWRKKED